MKHLNNYCNLESLDNKTVSFITTNNSRYVDFLKDTGNLIILQSDDRHDIYLGGEHIAGGYGFDENVHISKLTYIANEMYDSLSYVHDNITTITEIVGEHVKNNTVEVTYTDISYTDTVTVDNSTYKLVKLNENSDMYAFEWAYVTNLYDYKINMSNNEYITPLNNVITINVSNNSELPISNENSFILSFEGSYNISNIAIYTYNYLKNKNTQTYNNLTEEDIIKHSIDDIFQQYNIEMIDEHKNYKYTNNVTVDFYQYKEFCNLMYTGESIDKLMFSTLVTNINSNKELTKRHYLLANIFWSLPIFYFIGDNTPSEIYRKYDFTNKKILNIDKVEMLFGYDENNLSYGYFDIPNIDGYLNPKFLPISVGIDENNTEELLSAAQYFIDFELDDVSNIYYNFNSVNIKYTRYRTPNKYKGAITWKIIW
jgi:hypothetical protein